MGIEKRQEVDELPTMGGEGSIKYMGKIIAELEEIYFSYEVPEISLKENVNEYESSEGPLKKIIGELINKGYFIPSALKETKYDYLISSEKTYKGFICNKIMELRPENGEKIILVNVKLDPPIDIDEVQREINDVGFWGELAESP